MRSSRRDISAWMYDGGSINPMAKTARQHESLHLAHQPVTRKGGDIHVLGRGAVLIGMGKCTTPMAVESLARELFRAGQAATVIAVELPRSRAFMHLDTILTLVDVDTFVRCPGLDPDAPPNASSRTTRTTSSPSPGAVLGYERNTVTDSMLLEHGIGVLAIPGSELGRGRAGSRCMTCPTERAGI